MAMCGRAVAQSPRQHPRALATCAARDAVSASPPVRKRRSFRRGPAAAEWGRGGGQPAWGGSARRSHHKRPDVLAGYCTLMVPLPPPVARLPQRAPTLEGGQVLERQAGHHLQDCHALGGHRIGHVGRVWRGGAGEQGAGKLRESRLPAASALRQASCLCG